MLWITSSMNSFSSGSCRGLTTQLSKDLGDFVPRESGLKMNCGEEKKGGIKKSRLE